MILTRRPPSDFRQYFTVSEPVHLQAKCAPSFRDCQSVGQGSNTYRYKKVPKLQQKFIYPALCSVLTVRLSAPYFANDFTFIAHKVKVKVTL